MKILVIMPVYNQETRVQYAVESVIRQTHTDWHMIIINDGSTDATRQTLNQYKSDKRITIVHNKSQRGCYYSRNLGLQTAVEMNYDWNLHTIHDSDDVSSPIRFERCSAPFKDKKLMVLSTSYCRTSDNIKTFNILCNSESVHTGEGIGFFRREVFDNIGFYDTVQFGGDSEYYARTQKFCDIHKYHVGNFLSDILYIAHNHSKNLTKIHSNDIRDEYRTKYGKRLDTSSDLYLDFTIQ